MVYSQQDFQNDLTDYVAALYHFYNFWLEIPDIRGVYSHKPAYLTNTMKVGVRINDDIKDLNLETPHRVPFTVNSFFESLKTAHHTSEHYQYDRKLIIKPIDLITRGLHSGLTSAHSCLAIELHRLLKTHPRFIDHPDALKEVLEGIGLPYEKESISIVMYADENRKGKKVCPDELMDSLFLLEDHLGIDMDQIDHNDIRCYESFLTADFISEEAKSKLKFLIDNHVTADGSFRLEQIKLINGDTGFHLFKITEDNSFDAVHEQYYSAPIMQLIGDTEFLNTVINLATHVKEHIRNNGDGLSILEPSLRAHVNAGGFTGVDTATTHMIQVTPEHYRTAPLNQASGLSLSVIRSYTNAFLGRFQLGSMSYPVLEYDEKRGIHTNPHAAHIRTMHGEYGCPAKHKPNSNNLFEKYGLPYKGRVISRLFALDSTLINYAKEHLVDNYSEWQRYCAESEGIFIIDSQQDEEIRGEVARMIIERGTDFGKNR
jgi:hypothetical protein